MKSTYKRTSKLGSSSAPGALQSSQPNSLHDSWLESTRTVPLKPSNPMMKHKPHRKPNSLFGAKLQPLLKDASVPNLRSRSSSTESYGVLPHILQSQNSQALLSGISTGVSLPQPDCLCIYLCYNHEDMRAECEYLWSTAIPQLRQYCNERHVTIQFIDLNWHHERQLEPQPSMRLTSSIASRQALIADCETRSIGLSFVLLLGDSCGKTLIPTEINENQFKALQQVVSQQRIAGGDKLLTYYTKNDDVKPGFYLLQANIDVEQLDDIRSVLQSASSHLSNMLTEDDFRSLYRTAVEEEVASGVLRRSDARTNCLCYRREIQTTSGSSSVPSSDGVDRKPSADLWEMVRRYLGNGNWKSYVTAGRTSGESDEDRSYLERLSADFVTDVKTLIERSLAKVCLDRRKPEHSVVREVRHHASLQSCKLSGLSRDDVHGDLLKRVQAFVRDPHQSSRPFIVHGVDGAGKSTAMAAIGAALCDWFPQEGAVVVLRFIGTSTDAAEVHGTVASVARQVRLAYEESMSSASTVPGCDTLHGELAAFRELLENVSRSHAHTKPLFVLLDGIDSLFPWHDALNVLWVVRRLPPNVHLILSTTGSRSGNGPPSTEAGPDILGALLALVTDAELTFEVFSGRAIEDKLTSSNVGVGSLSGALDSLEDEFGKNVVTLFCAYVSIAIIGITDCELSDLLSSNADVASDLGIPFGSHFASALVAELRTRLADYLEDRLVHGRRGFGWRRIGFRRTVAARYGFIVSDGKGAGTGGADLSAESTHLTLMLHESIANLHLQNSSDRSSLFVENSSHSNGGDDRGQTRSTLVHLAGENPLTLGRLMYHMRVLLPLEGLARLNKCLLFNFQWLQARLASAPIYVVLDEVFSIYKLAADMHRLSLTEERAQGDVGELFEFLQMAKTSLSADHRNLAVEIAARLEPLEFTPLFGSLVRDAKQWLFDERNFASFVPLWPVWRRPGGTLRHCMNGPTHVVGFVDGAEVAVTYGEMSGIGVWRVQTGTLLHRFDVRSEQKVSGIVSANGSTFVVSTFYSHVEQNTELSVLSTETGLELLNTKFPLEIETVSLSDDDQMIALSTLDKSGSDGPARKRSIIGVRVMSKEVEFRLQVNEVHADGIAKIIFVQNIRRDAQSVLSLGCGSSCDLAFWDLSSSSLDFVLDLGCGIDHIRLAVERKMAVCLSSDTGTLIVVNLSRGSIEQKLHGDEYLAASDVAIHDDNIFVATRTRSVVVLSMTQNSVVGKFDGGSQSIPSKLAVGSFNEMALLFVGYEDGDIRVFDVGAETIVGSLCGGHRCRINSLCVLTEGRLVSSGDDRRAIVWNYESCLESDERRARRQPDIAADQKAEGDRKLEDSIQEVRCFTFSRDETQVIGGLRSGIICVWDASSGALVRQLGQRSEVSVDRVNVALGGQLLVAHRCIKTASSRDVRSLEVWNLEKGELVEFRDSDLLVYCSQLLPTDSHLMTIGPSADTAMTGIVVAIHGLDPMRTLTVMDCNIHGSMDASNLRVIGFSKKPPKRSPLGVRRPPSGRTFIPSATKRIAAGGLPAAKRSSPKLVAARVDPPSSDTGMEALDAVLDYFPKSGVSYFFSFSIGGRLDSLSMERTDPMNVETVSPECCVLLPRGGACVCGTTSGTLIQWNIRSRATETLFVDVGVKPALMPSSPQSLAKSKLAHNGPVTCLAIDDVSQLLVSGGNDRKVKVWNMVAKELLISLSGHEGSITCLHLTPQKVIVSAAKDGTLRVWKRTSLDISRSANYRRHSVFHLHGLASSVTMTTDRQRVAAIVQTEPVDRSVLFLLRSINM